MAKIRWVLLLTTALAGAGALIWLARHAADAASTSDTAVLESYTLLASQGRLALGPYSRFQWHHPGPLYFFWMAPFYVLSGFRTTGLNAGALALNTVALLVTFRVVSRRAGSVLGLAVVATLSLYLCRSPEVLTSPWNPHIPVVPMAALLVTTADVVSGGTWTLPLVASFASLAGQTHVGLLPTAMALGVVALVGGAIAGPAGTSVRPSSLTRPALTTGVVLLVLWLPSLVEQVAGEPGNMTQLWTFFVSESHPGQSVADAFSAWSDMLSGVVRPDFYVAHGWRFRESPVKWAEALALAQGAGLLLCAAFAARARRGFECALASLLAMVSLIALWSITRIDGAIFDHEVFWMSVIGALNTAVVVSFALQCALARVRPPTVPRWLPLAMCWLLTMAVMATGVQQLREAVRHAGDPGDESATTKAIAEDLRRYLEEQRVSRPLIRIDQDAWGVAAGVILQLQKAGMPLSVEDDWIAMFTPVFASNGREPVTLAVTGRAQHVRLLDVSGDSVIVSREPFYVHRESAGVSR